MGDVEVQKPVGLPRPVGSSPMNDTFDLHHNFHQDDPSFSLQGDQRDDDDDDDDDDDSDSDEGDWILEDELAKLRAEWDDYVDNLEGELESGEFSPLDMEEILKKHNDEWGALPEVVRTDTKVKFSENLISLAVPPPAAPVAETINYHIEVERRDVSSEGGGDTEELDMRGVEDRLGKGDRTVSDQEGKGDAEVKIGGGEAAKSKKGAVHDDDDDSDGTLEGDDNDQSDIYAEQLDARLDEISTERTEQPDEGGEITHDPVKEDLKTRVEPNANGMDVEEVKRTTEHDKMEESERIGTDQKSEVVKDTKEEQVLIERDGKFELKKASELSPEERHLMGISPAPEEPKEDQKKGQSSEQKGKESPMTDKTKKTKKETPTKRNTPVRKDTPTKKDRPSTALGYQTPPKQSFQRRRVQSAKASPAGSEDSSGGYERPIVGSSPYGLTPEQKELRRKQMLVKNQRSEEKRQRDEEEKRAKIEEAESAFQAWVKRKQQEAVERKKQDKQKQKEEPTSSKKDPKEAHEVYEAWLKTKKEQAKLERKVKGEKKKEDKEAYFYRSRNECDAAFKEWVKMKRKQLKDDNAIKRSGAQATNQKPRKARNLSKTSQAAEPPE